MAAAPVLVQESTLAIAASNSIIPTLPSGSTAGNLLIVVLAADFTGNSAPSAPTGWTLFSWGGTNTGLASPEMDIFYKNNCSANETLPTFQRIGATNVMCIAYEYSGQDLHDPLGAGVTSVNSGGFTSATMNMGSNTVAVNTIFSAICLYNATANSQTVSYSSGWTADQNDGTVSDLHLATANWTAGGLPTSETISWSSAQQYSGFIIYVQGPHISRVSSGVISSSTSTSVTAAFFAATTAGNLLVAQVGCVVNSINVVGCKTTASGWIAVNPDAGGNSCIWYKPNCGASETAPTFTPATGTLVSMYASLSEWFGADTTSPLDKSGILTTTSVSPITATNTSFDTQTDDLVIASFTAVGSKSATWSFSQTSTPSNVTINATSTGTKASTAFEYINFLANGNGGSANDSIVITITPSTGTLSQAGAQIASFKRPVSIPHPASFVVLQSRTRASYW